MLAIDAVYQPKDVDEVQRRLLDDIELSARKEGVENVPIQKGTDTWHRTRANAGMHLVLFGAVAASADATRILDADYEELIEIRDARGLPDVGASRASGKVAIRVSGGGTVTIPDGFQCALPNGLRAEVDGQQLNKSDGDEVPTVVVDAGEAGNLESGQKVRWVTGNILNLQTEATVSNTEPIVGGLDQEDEARLRARLINSVRNNPQGGNWAQIIEWAMEASAAVQYAFVYPALGGPGQFKLVVCRAPNIDENDFSRVLGSTVRNAIDAYVRAKISDHVEFVVQPSADVEVDCTILATLPPTQALGGDGNGWTNDVPWPVPESGNRVTVAAVTSPTVIRINVTPEPTPGTTILWWATSERRFVPAIIQSVAGSAMAWVVTLDTPLTDETSTDVAVGDYISPGCARYEEYSEAVRSMLLNHGPGENTSDPDLLPRSQRQPRPNESFFLPKGKTHIEPIPTDIGTTTLCSLIDPRPEIADAVWGYRSATTPAIPPFPSGAPECFIPGRFGVYPRT